MYYCLPISTSNTSRYLFLLAEGIFNYSYVVFHTQESPTFNFNLRAKLFFPHYLNDFIFNACLLSTEPQQPNHQNDIIAISSEYIAQCTTISCRLEQ